jgi:hypothetical protein
LKAEHFRILTLLLLGAVAAIPPGLLPVWVGMPVSTIVVVLFWWAHAFRIRAINWRFLAGFGAVSLVSWLVLGGAGVTGFSENPDFDPTQISSLKRSRRVALRLYFDHEPTPDERYLKLGTQSTPPPGAGEERARVWASEHLGGLGSSHTGLQEKLMVIRDWFTSSFRYSLDSGWRSLDEFLFDSQQGYCLHFSYSTQALLRMAGENAQLVYGYSGGSWNPVTRLLTYRDEDAHSWLEVRNPESGLWVREDPTRWITSVEPDTDPAGEGALLSKEAVWTGLGVVAALVALLGGWWLLLRDPGLQLFAVLRTRGALSAGLARLGREHPSLATQCERLNEEYERLRFARPRTGGAALRARASLGLRILRLRIHGWKYLSRFRRGQPGA